MSPECCRGVVSEPVSADASMPPLVLLLIECDEGVAAAAVCGGAAELADGAAGRTMAVPVGAPPTRIECAFNKSARVDNCAENDKKVSERT
jgi:hypothetical protein